jgi:hypothetical protein
MDIKEPIADLQQLRVQYTISGTSDRIIFALIDPYLLDTLVDSIKKYGLIINNEEYVVRHCGFIFDGLGLSFEIIISTR